jgi:uncharacterized phage protein gp47/JayE
MIYKSFNDVVTSMLDYLRLVQNSLDTKPGTVARDLFVDSPSQEIAEVYTQLRNVANLSSMFSASGTDLDNLASNFSTIRNPGSASNGVAVFTTNSLTSDVLISAGSVVVSNNGISFQVITSVVMQATSANVYKATATRLSTELNLAGITDQYAIEVSVESLTLGSNSNIGPYALVSQNISGISNVTNLQSFTGGADPESDDAFRTRILSIFAGSNTGTSLGYTTTVNAIAGVESSVTIGPGNPLMTRDGTQVVTESGGTIVITSAGSGGDVDIYILGSDLVSQTDSYIYVDKSGMNDPTSPLNDFILGQQGQSTTLNVQQRRLNEIASGTLPFQPIDSIVSVAGSSSGPNFIEQYTDSAGIVHGNYELIQDTGDYGGSPFGFDRLRWISSFIELDDEEVTKGIFNGTDKLQFTDVEEIQSITQAFLITNESDFANADNRSQVTLQHTPIQNVSRVVNLTTGERYVISNQNPNGTSGTLNTSGVITISGNTLPSATDVLQIDYIWIKPFDRVYDFDNLKDYNSNRIAQNSINWGFGNLVQNESVIVTKDVYNNLLVTLANPVYSVLSVSSFSTQTASVLNGAIILSPGTIVSNVVSARRTTDNAELFNTDSHSGILTGTNIITLPTDTLAKNGDIALVIFNSLDVFGSDAYGPGSFVNNIIYLSSNIVNVGETVLVSYIANVSALIPETNISLLPAIGYGNEFIINGVETGYQPTANDSYQGIITNNLRRASSNLQVTVGAIPSNGVISILGTTEHLVTDAIVGITSSGLTIDLMQTILNDSGLSSLPSSIFVSKIYSVELVKVNSSNAVTSVDYTYDVINYTINNNSYDVNTALSNTSLSNTVVVLPSTPTNVVNQFVIGDMIRVTFYYVNTNDNESVYFSTNGTQITSNIFNNVSKIYVNSGFTTVSNALSGTFTVSNFNQPADNSLYDVTYDYVAPQENERITITYNYNSIIDTATLAIEKVRPITADVLVKEATALNIDVSVEILLLPAYQSQATTVTQNVTQAASTFLTATSLGTTVYSAGLINALFSVPGVADVTILNFSIVGGSNTTYITAQGNQYLNAGIINVKVGD